MRKPLICRQVTDKHYHMVVSSMEGLDVLN